MSQQTDFRVERITRAIVNGKPVKMFTAFAKMGDAFVHVGQFTANNRTPNRDLWRVAAEALAAEDAARPAGDTFFINDRRI